MKQLMFDEWACRNMRAKLDSYIDDELLVETNLEIARHFQNCGGCAQEAAERRVWRGRVRAAARAVPTPTGLDERVRARLRREGRLKTPWSLMAIAAVVVLCFGSWFTYERRLLRAGVGDHLHGAVIRQGSLKPVGQSNRAAARSRWGCIWLLPTNALRTAESLCTSRFVTSNDCSQNFNSRSSVRMLR